MASAKLGTKASGSIIKLNESGIPVEYLIVQQGKPASGNYDDSCNGTWVRRKDIYSNRQWHTSDVNDYANSAIDSWLNNESSGFLSLLDADIRAAVKTVKIPYRPGSGASYTVSSGANGLSCKAFLLSMKEVDLTPSYSPTEGAALEYFSGGGNSKRVANLNGAPARWWSRSPYCYGGGDDACGVGAGGSADGWDCSGSYGCCPALILDSELLVSDDGTVSTNEPPTAPGSISVTGVVGGGNASITLTAATDPDGTVESYRYERRVDGGSWTQFADVDSLTQSDSVSGDWGTVAYRACAVDDAGAAGPYVTSETETVNNGYLLIGGPASNMGSQSKPFTFDATVGVSGETGITGIEATMWLDYVRVYHESVNQGATLEYDVDTRVMSSGQHTIQVTLEKEDYLPANAAYYFTVPSQGLPDGGKSTQLRNDQGNPIFPRTTTRDVIGPNGLTVQNEIETLQKAHRGTTGHLEHIDTVLGPASNVEWPREANTTYATRMYPSGLSASKIFLQTFNSTTSGAQSLGDAALNFEADTITLTSLASNTLLELLKYVLDSHVVTPPDPTMNFTPLEQPKVLTAATNTGTSATDLTDALNQMLNTYPNRNNYLLTSTDGDVTYYVVSVDAINADTTSKTVAYVASTNPTKWYDNAQMAFVDSSNPANSFTQLSGDYTSQITTAGTGSDKGSQNAALIALLQTNKGYYYKFTDHAGTVYYMASTTAISMSGDSVTANCDYVKNTETTVYTGGTISFNKLPDAPNWTVGQVVTFAGIQWIVSHKTANECYLTLKNLDGKSTWNNLQGTCTNWASKLNPSAQAFLKSVTAGNTSGKVFVATKDQMDGGFSYFNSNSRRNLNEVYWTSTEYSSGSAWPVDLDGSLDDAVANKSSSRGFRPSVCIDLTLF